MSKFTRAAGIVGILALQAVQSAFGQTQQATANAPKKETRAELQAKLAPAFQGRIQAISAHTDVERKNDSTLYVSFPPISNKRSKELDGYITDRNRNGVYGDQGDDVTLFSGDDTYSTDNSTGKITGSSSKASKEWLRTIAERKSAHVQFNEYLEAHNGDTTFTPSRKERNKVLEANHNFDDAVKAEQEANAKIEDFRNVMITYYGLKGVAAEAKATAPITAPQPTK